MSQPAARQKRWPPQDHDMHTGDVAVGTTGTMNAARQFAQALQDSGLLSRTWRVKCELLCLPGPAHRDRAIDKAVMLGLEGGEAADCVDVMATARRLRHIHDMRELRLLGTRRIAFDKRHHLVFVRDAGLPGSCDRMRLSAFDPAGKLLLERSFEAREMANRLSAA
jgi:L-serine dehydratase